MKGVVSDMKGCPFHQFSPLGDIDYLPKAQLVVRKANAAQKLVIGSVGNPLYSYYVARGQTCQSLSVRNLMVYSHQICEQNQPHFTLEVMEGIEIEDQGSLTGTYVQLPLFQPLQLTMDSFFLLNDSCGFMVTSFEDCYSEIQHVLQESSENYIQITLIKIHKTPVVFSEYRTIGIRGYGSILLKKIVDGLGENCLIAWDKQRKIWYIHQTNYEESSLTNVTEVWSLENSEAMNKGLGGSNVSDNKIWVCLS